MPNVVTGTDGGETLGGTAGDDDILALGGDDIIDLSLGHDNIDGGVGDDLVRGVASALGVAAGPRSYTITGNRIFDGSGALDTSFSNVERIDFSDTGNGDVTLDASGFTGAFLRFTTGSGNHHLTGSPSNDAFTLFGGSVVLDGGAGFDSAVVGVDPSHGPAYVTESGGRTIFTQDGSQLLSANDVEFFAMFSSGLGQLEIDASGSAANIDFYTSTTADIIVGSTGSNSFWVATGFTGSGDVFAGFGGADHYLYGSLSGLNGATILDLDSDDDLNLSNDVTASFIGTDAFTGIAGQYRYYAFDGETFLAADTNGDRVADQLLTIADGEFFLGETAPGSNILHITGVQPPPNPGPDNIVGTEGDDLIETGAGNDVIDGRGGNDTIDAGADNDHVDGGTGNDIIHGGTGEDVIDGGVGQDSIYGDAGNDTLSATGGTGDWLFGGLGDDTLTASGGSFNMFGDDGGSTGDDGNDHLTLTQGGTNSWLDGGGGDDVISASGSGTVVIGGGTGNDDVTVTGYSHGNIDLGEGSDVLRLPAGFFTVNLDFDPGHDTVIISTVAAGFMTITGFWAGEEGDRLDLSIYGADPFAAGTLVMGHNGPDTIIDASGMRYVLQNVLPANLSAYNLGVPNPSFAPIGMTLDDAFASDPTVAHAGLLIGGDGNDLIRGYGGDDRLFGAGGNDRLEGGGGADLLSGGSGADTMSGGQGNDTYFVDNAGDAVVESAGGGFDLVYTNVSYVLSDDVERLGVNGFTTTYDINLTGNDLNNEIWGNDGRNILDGGAGADILHGNGGDDTYFVDNVGDVVIDSAGSDLVYTSIDYTLGANIERLGVNGFTTTYDINLTGNSLDNEIWGNDGRNLIDGGAGADIMHGNGGDDIYFVDNVGDVVLDSSGFDLVYTSVSYTLDSTIERLGVNGFTTSYDINLTGNGLDNELWGNDGKNVLNGGAGADIMRGFGGDDTYFVDNAGDVVVDSAGFDLIYTSVSYTLPNGVERLGVNGFTTTYEINLTGNDADNEIWGNDGTNVLDGGLGSDILHGNGGNDTFAFTTALGGGNVDVIADFQAGDDKIGLNDAVFTAIGDMGALNANAFIAGTAAHDADDRIIYDAASGNLYYDADGNGAGAAVLFATLSGQPAITASDFMVT